MKAGGEGDDRWDGWMASPTQWTWIWVNSGSLWWTGRPGMLQFMGSQRVRHDWVTELNLAITSLLTSNFPFCIYHDNLQDFHFFDVLVCKINLPWILYLYISLFILIWIVILLLTFPCFDFSSLQKMGYTRLNLNFNPSYHTVLKISCSSFNSFICLN